ncbi:hypothetical protein UK12_01120 [Saccharothrix sp. ST-888]|nr:hypothetical protein UK12_01120 [Saccharothrix sp. ST-888]
MKSLGAVTDRDLQKLLELHSRARIVFTTTAPVGQAEEPSPSAAELMPSEPPTVPVTAEPSQTSVLPAEPSGTLPVWRRRPVVIATAAAALVVLVCTLLLLRPAEPHQSVSTAGAGQPAPCRGVGCNGKDPAQTGCEADDHTLLTTNNGKVVLYLHYSPRCQAAWSSLTDGEPGDTATITTGTGQQQTALIHQGFDNYSTMLDASDPKTTLQVCGVQPAGRACTLTYSDPVDQPWVAQPSPSPTATPSQHP